MVTMRQRFGRSPGNAPRPQPRATTGVRASESPIDPKAERRCTWAHWSTLAGLQSSRRQARSALCSSSSLRWSRRAFVPCSGHGLGRRSPWLPGNQHGPVWAPGRAAGASDALRHRVVASGSVEASPSGRRAAETGGVGRKRNAGSSRWRASLTASAFQLSLARDARPIHVSRTCKGCRVKTDHRGPILERGFLRPGARHSIPILRRVGRRCAACPAALTAQRPTTTTTGTTTTTSTLRPASPRAAHARP